MAKSSLGHLVNKTLTSSFIATDHLGLLIAMFNDNEVNMLDEIEALAKYDKKFNESYKAYLQLKSALPKTNLQKILKCSTPYG